MSALTVPSLNDGVVQLRPPVEDDAPAIFAACQDLEITRFNALPSPYEQHHATGWVATVPETWLSGTSAPMVVLDVPTGDLLGACGLLEIHDRQAEIGYWVKREARGRGVATRAVVLVTNWGLSELGLTLIELLCDMRNVASQRVAEKAGYTRAGEAAPPARCVGRSALMARFVTHSTAPRHPAV